eukprot:SAG31_NODE_211_length_20274_cov_40.333482_12_plen_91_part_00
MLSGPLSPVTNRNRRQQVSQLSDYFTQPCSSDRENSHDARSMTTEESGKKVLEAQKLLSSMAYSASTKKSNDLSQGSNKGSWTKEQDEVQ